MKFTINRKELMKGLRKSGRKKDAVISAADGKVSITSSDTVALAADVHESGQCELQKKAMLTRVLDTFSDDEITVSVDDGRLAIGSFSMSVKEY